MTTNNVIDAFAQPNSSTRIIDKFFKFDVVVNANEFDLVNSYFNSVCGNSTIAKTFTAYLFRISNLTNIPVQYLLDEIKGKTKLEVNTVIAYYLNSFKSKTVLYGISSVPTPNEPVARNILV